MGFNLINDSPSLMKPGVYQSGLPEIWMQEHYDQAVAIVAGGNYTPTIYGALYPMIYTAANVPPYPDVNAIGTSTGLTGLRDNLLGLNTIDLEKYSLGNWNSIIRNNRKFWSPLTDPSMSSLIEKGRPVQFSFVPTHIISFDIVNGAEQNFSRQPLSYIKTRGVNHNNAAADQSILTDLDDRNKFPNSMLAQLFNVSSTGPGGWAFGDLLSSRSVNYDYAYIQKRLNTDSSTFQVLLDAETKGRMNSIHIWSWTFTFPNSSTQSIKYVLSLDGIFNQEGNLVGTIPVSDVQMRLSDDGSPITVSINPGGYNPSSGIINLQTAGMEDAPSEFGYPDFAPSNLYSTVEVEPVDFEVSCFISSSIDTIPIDSVESALEEKSLFYYDIDDPKFGSTSYPVEVCLGINLYNKNIDNVPEPSDLNEYELLDLFYGVPGETSQDQLFEDSMTPEDAVYYYTVVQWGDEDVLLSNDEILNTEYFALYEREEYPEEDDFLLKRARYSQQIDSKKILFLDEDNDNNLTLNLFNHVYNTPGIKTIKIIVYRYTKDLNFLNETILVTKNIVISDGTALAQDFEIFGGTDFNFLPLREKEAMIGGLDPESQYVVSTNKLKRSDLYEKDDFLDKKSSEEFIENFNDGQYGESLAEKLDLSQVRYFKSVSQDGIYHFINANINSVVGSNFPSFQDDFYNDSVVQDNSIATDIFINKSNSYLKDDCLVEMNPEKTEFLSIDNTVGNPSKGILIGDYKLEKVENQKLRKLGIMDTPNLENEIEEQAF